MDEGNEKVTVYKEEHVIRQLVTDFTGSYVCSLELCRGVSELELVVDVSRGGGGSVVVVVGVIMPPDM